MATVVLPRHPKANAAPGSGTTIPRRRKRQSQQRILEKTATGPRLAQCWFCRTNDLRDFDLTPARACRGLAASCNHRGLIMRRLRLVGQYPRDKPRSFDQPTSMPIPFHPLHFPRSHDRARVEAFPLAHARGYSKDEKVEEELASRWFDQMPRGSPRSSLLPNRSCYMNGPR